MPASSNRRRRMDDHPGQTLEVDEAANLVVWLG
jgi:hypothetical protein